MRDHFAGALGPEGSPEAGVVGCSCGAVEGSGSGGHSAVVKKDGCVWGVDGEERFGPRLQKVDQQQSFRVLIQLVLCIRAV